MRVALNLLYLVEKSGGVGRYMTELTGGLVRAGVDVVGLHGEGLPARVTEAPWAERVEWVHVDVDVRSGPPWSFLTTTSQQWAGNARRARVHGAELLHGPAYIGPPLGGGIRSVVTVPDLIYTRYGALLDRRTRIGMRMTVGPSARGADRVIAISNTVRDDVVATLGVPSGRVDVTPLGAEIRLGTEVTPDGPLRERHALGAAPFILCVAQKRVHKNLDGLIRAFARLAAPDVSLVLVGLSTPHETELRILATELGVASRVHHLGWVEDADVEGLYASAAVCCLPSFEEGFGLPVIEAMARGVPVACSGIGALAEVGGEAAERFDPTDPGAIAAALDRVLGDPVRRAALVAKGLVRGREFSWDACAAATIASYEKALREPGRRGRRRSKASRRP